MHAFVRLAGLAVRDRSLRGSNADRTSLEYSLRFCRTALRRWFSARCNSAAFCCRAFSRCSSSRVERFAGAVSRQLARVGSEHIHVAHAARGFAHRLNGFEQAPRFLSIAGREHAAAIASTRRVAVRSLWTSWVGDRRASS